MFLARAVRVHVPEDRVEGGDGFLHFPSNHQPEVEPPESDEPECDPLHEPLLPLPDPVSQPEELEDPEE